MNIGICGNISTDMLAGQIDQLFPGQNIIIGNPDHYLEELSNPFGEFLNLDIFIIAIDWSKIVPSVESYIPGDDFSTTVESFTHQIIQIEKTLTEFRKFSAAKLLIFSPVSPNASPAGFIDRMLPFSSHELHSKIQSVFSNFLKSVTDLYPVDLELIFSSIGKNYAYDFESRYLNNYPFSETATGAIADQIVKTCIQLSKYPLKCIILDLDNTLWGGVVGELGTENILLSDTGAGKAFKNFQAEIIRLYHQGVILAVCSKNNTCDALDVFEHHPHMLIRPNMISSFRINWDDKPKNILEIARELNIGLDSIMFIDDSISEQELVKTTLPQIEVLALPDNPFLFASTLRHCSRLWPLQITIDDQKRGLYLSSERRRIQAQTIASNIEAFLRSSDINVSIAKCGKSELPRVTQLFNKTNQFNLSTIRYSINELEKTMQVENNHLFYMEMKDRFGDYGIISAALIKENLIDSFVLSCRAFGKNAEQAFIGYLLKFLEKRGYSTVYAQFVPSLKNHMTESFYSSCNFTFDHKIDNRHIWSFSFNKNLFKSPDWITINS